VEAGITARFFPVCRNRCPLATLLSTKARARENRHTLAQELPGLIIHPPLPRFCPITYAPQFLFYINALLFLSAQFSTILDRTETLWTNPLEKPEKGASPLSTAIHYHTYLSSYL
jgi:hypothetical protein